MKNLFTTFFCIICLIPAAAQDLPQEYLNTLEDEELLTIFNEVDSDSTKAELVARTYLDRAKRQKDTIKMARGYDRLARIFQPEKNMVYADSIIYLTNGLGHKTYPALGYLIKGYEYIIIGDLVNSTKNFHILYDYALKNNNVAHQLYALNFLINAKSQWGDKKEALNLQKKYNNLIKREDFVDMLSETTRKGYLKNVEDLAIESEIVSTYGFINCYINLKEFEKANQYLDLLSLKVKTYQGLNKETYLLWPAECQLELYFYTNDYTNFELLSDELVIIQKNSNDHSGLFDNYGFRGLANFEQNKNKEGLFYLLKADSIYENFGIQIFPYRRRVFEELLSHYREKSNDIKQIEYLNRLISIDSIFKINYQYFEPENIKKIETPQLIKHKEAIISRLKYKNKKFRRANWLIAFFLIFSLVVGLYYFNRQLIYKKRFNSLLVESNNSRMQLSENQKNTISSDVVEDVLRKLVRFEENLLFLRHNLSLQYLAKSFNTNSNYLSRVINLKMEKNFSQYLHDLRIEYSMNELLNNSKFRNYTIKAIAEECGYTNAESFSRAFYKKNGIYPSYYIKMINQTKS